MAERIAAEPRTPKGHSAARDGPALAGRWAVVLVLASTMVPSTLFGLTATRAQIG